MEDMGFDTPGILRDILERMERDFGLNRLSLPSDILEPLDQFTREFSNDEEQYTSLPAFSVSARAELHDDDDWWRLPLHKRRKLKKSSFFPKYHSPASRYFDSSSRQYSDIDLDEPCYSTSGQRKLGGHRDTFDKSGYIRRRFSDTQHLGNTQHIGNTQHLGNTEHHGNGHCSTQATTIPIKIENRDNSGIPLPVGRSKSVPLQDFEYQGPSRPRSAPVDISQNLPYRSLFDKEGCHKTPQVSQKFDELHRENEKWKRPVLPSSSLPVGPEIRLNDQELSSSQTSQRIKRLNLDLKNGGNSGSEHRHEEKTEANPDVTGHLRKLLTDLCSDAQRNSLPPLICKKEGSLVDMHEEVRSESLPDIVKCDARTLNGRVPRFSFRGGENLPWPKRQQRIEAALSWLRSELELLRAQDKTLLVQLQRCQESIDALKKQKTLAVYDSDDEPHWEDWELAEYERICDNDNDSTEKTEGESSVETVISMYELKPIRPPVTDVECSV